MLVRYAVRSLIMLILWVSPVFSLQLPVPSGQGNYFPDRLPRMLHRTQAFPTLLNQGDFLLIEGHTVRRYNPYTKHNIWKIKQAYELNTKATCNASLCFITDERGVLYAYNIFSGALKWRVVLPSTTQSRVLAEGEKLFVQTDNDYVLSLATHTAHIRWSIHFSQPEPSLEMIAEPRVWHGYVWCVLRNGQLVGMRIDTGEIKYHEILAEPDISLISDIPMPLDATPLIFDHLLLVSAYNSGVKAFDLQHQKLISAWHLKAIQGVMVMSKDDHRVYILDMNHDVWAINPLNGYIIWHRKINSSLISHMVVTTGYVLLKEKNHWIYLNKESGQIASVFSH